MEGFAELREARDLLTKLENDLALLGETPADSYRAFNFFVTAEHILDWRYPGGRGSEGAAKRKALRNSQELLKVVSHIANGAKHLILDDPKHQSVQHVDQVNEPFGSGAYGAGPYGGAAVVVMLEGTAAAEFGDSISALDLAQQVVAFWRDQEL